MIVVGRRLDDAVGGDEPGRPQKAAERPDVDAAAERLGVARSAAWSQVTTRLVSVSTGCNALVPLAPSMSGRSRWWFDHHRRGRRRRDRCRPSSSDMAPRRAASAATRASGRLGWRTSTRVRSRTSATCRRRPVVRGACGSTRPRLAAAPARRKNSRRFMPADCSRFPRIVTAGRRIACRAGKLPPGQRCVSGSGNHLARADAVGGRPSCVRSRGRHHRTRPTEFVGAAGCQGLGRSRARYLQ